MIRAAYILCAFVLTGCGSINESLAPADTPFVKDARLQKAADLPDVSLSIVKTAESHTREALFFAGGSWFKSRVGAHSAVLVKHPQRTLLFDTGLGNKADAQFDSGMPFWLKPFMAYDHHQSAQTLLADVTRTTPVQHIILSHLHWDHASGIKDFPDAEVWTTREEYEGAMRPDAPEGGYIPSQYSGSAIHWHFMQFEQRAYENFDRSLDVFDDGSVVLVPLPGHTLGAVGMFVNLRSGKRFFFTGDATWAVEGFQIPAQVLGFRAAGGSRPPANRANRAQGSSANARISRNGDRAYARRQSAKRHWVFSQIYSVIDFPARIK